MERVEIVVLGGGVLGLAVSARFAALGRQVVLLEKNRKFGQETSSRNSEVIHSGIYYEPGSLKARFCLEGNSLTYAFCDEHGIPYRQTGKMIVALSNAEEAELHRLKHRALENGVTGTRFLTSDEITERAPDLKVTAALFCPTTGIVDTHSMMASLERHAIENKAHCIYSSEVTNVTAEADSFVIEVNRDYRFRTQYLVNCAGLFADKIARMVGLDYRLHYCKGDYFRCLRSLKTKSLIYPIPRPRLEGLGIHATVDLQGRVRFGPDTEYVDAISYAIDENKRGAFCESINRYFPSIRPEDLVPDTSGIRPKLAGPGEPVRDFVVQRETERGLPHLYNLIGIESPGFTSALAIAKSVTFD